MSDITELVEQIKRLTSEIERFRISTLIELPPLLNGSSKRRPNYFWWDGHKGVTAVDVGGGWHLTGENYYLPIDRRITDSDMEFLRQKTDPPEKMPLYEALYKLDALNKTDAAQANVEAPTIDANRSEVGEEPNDTERGSRVAYEFLLGDLHLGEDALNPWKVPGKPLAAHRIVLARFDGGWPDWRLECLHDSADETWHVYCDDCNDPDCVDRYHHNSCILPPWWDDEEFGIVADTDGPINIPFDVDVEWWMDVPRLVPRIAKD
jgi:hypothetical protein